VALSPGLRMAVLICILLIILAFLNIFIIEDELEGPFSIRLETFNY